MAVSARSIPLLLIYFKTMARKFRGGRLATAVGLSLIAGCGMVAAPQPPSLKLPEPVTNLTAQRVGNRVDLRWTMPKRDTDNVLLQGGQTAEICRGAGSEKCEKVGRVVLAPQVEGTFADVLPPALLSGAPRPLTYVVELENHAGRSAGPSNTAYTAAGTVPATLANLQARAQSDGIELNWTPMGGVETVRIRRVLVEKTATPKEGHKPPAPVEQTLEFTGEDKGVVLDQGAALDHVYTYTVQRVANATLENKNVEMDSTPSEPVTVNARDVFPPAVPQGLQAVADPEAHTIDLSWQPDSDADLAGYIVYRRDAESGAAPVRISGAAEPGPSFRDMKAEPGHEYRYSVSAVDKDGNESARSVEAQERLPQQQ